MRSYTFSTNTIGAVFVRGMLELVLRSWDFTSAPICPGVISKAVPYKKTNMLFFSGTCISQFLSKKCHFMKRGTEPADTKKRMRGK